MPIGTPQPTTPARGPSYLPHGAPLDPYGWGQANTAGGPLAPQIDRQFIGLAELGLVLESAPGPNVWATSDPTDPVPAGEAWRVTRITYDTAVVPWLVALNGALNLVEVDRRDVTAVSAGGLLVWVLGTGNLQTFWPGWWITGERALGAWATGSDPGFAPPTSPSISVQVERYQLIAETAP